MEPTPPSTSPTRSGGFLSSGRALLPSSHPHQLLPAGQSGSSAPLILQQNEGKTPSRAHAITLHYLLGQLHASAEYSAFPNKFSHVIARSKYALGYFFPCETVGVIRQRWVIACASTFMSMQTHSGCAQTQHPMKWGRTKFSPIFKLIFWQDFALLVRSVLCPGVRELTTLC